MADDSECVVRSSRVEKPVHYTLKIQSFSLLKKAAVARFNSRGRYESQTFIAGGYEWKLALYPNGDEKRNGCGHISLYLVMVDNKVLSTTSEVNVMFTFLVYDNLKDKYLTVLDGKIRRFSAIKTEWGFEKLVPLETFNVDSNGLLVGDCCVFGVDIFVIKCDDGKGEMFSLIKQPKNYKYTWKINNFSQLDHITHKESDIFTVEGCRWKVRLFPKGCSKAKSGFLSLYLHLDNLEELPQSCRVYVEYQMAVLSQLGVEPKKGTCDCWFGFGGIGSGSAWGYQDFLSLSDLEEPTKGFVLNDKLIVEVEIKVISTFKKFE